jgi:hypothetical protein
MSYQPNRARRRPDERSARNRRLGCLVALIWVVLAVVLGYQYWLRPQVSAVIGREVGRQLGDGPPGATDVAAQVEQGAAQALPTAVAALPTGELRVSEQEANDYIGANREALGPIDELRVRFEPGMIRVELRALGVSGAATSELAVQDGRVVAVDPQIEGPLSSLIAIEDLVRPLEQQLNDQLAAQGRRITDVRIEPGFLIVNVE